MKKIILFIIISFLISSCNKQELILNDLNAKNKDIFNENDFVEIKYEKEKLNVYTVIPHHNLVNKEIDSFYNNLKETYSEFDNIFIIAPNHFTNTNFSFIENSKYCFYNNLNSCINGKKLDFYKSKINIDSFTKKDDLIITKEHGIGNHFNFINKYFPNSEVFTYLLKIKTSEDDFLNDLYEKIKTQKLEGKTLFIASVDFSHHVNDKIAVFHDLKTIDFLNNKSSNNIEVDCPNCLYLIKKLANFDNKNNFLLKNRTSNDQKNNVNTNYNNTSHIYGEFLENPSASNFSFSGIINETKFEQTLTGSQENNYIYAMAFGDAHFTRGFTYNSNPLKVENYLDCFYSNNDINKSPQYWHNRMFYGLDLVGINLETSVGEETECQDSEKAIKFRTEPKYLDNFKEIGINLYDISNNHSYDCGEIGFNATKKYLQEKGLFYFGDGRKTEGNILKQEINGTKVAFVGFNDVDLYYDKKIKSDKVKNLSAEGYNVIVNMHWGSEYSLISNNRQKEIARELIDSGAKLIIGHHPHVVQDFEIYKGVPIFYSLGNFIFDQPFEDTLKGYTLVYAINSKGVKYNLIEFKRDKNTYKIDCDSFR